MMQVPSAHKARRMKCAALLVVTVTPAWAFTGPWHRAVASTTTTALGYRSSIATIDVAETAQRRNVDALPEWAQSCGAEMVAGLRVVQTAPSINNPDGQDFHLKTTEPIAADTPVIYIPRFLTLSSADISQELGGNLEAAENALESADRLPLFRLLVKILSEVEQGDASPFEPWLNALPRRFHNGVAMTAACFECLPPYASYLASQERYTFEIFVQALREGYLELSADTLQDTNLLQWAYNVALTRHQMTWDADGNVQKIIAPVADLLNHATWSNCAVQFDDEGNAYVTATQDIPANTALTLSYGDPTDPTPLFAKYGFLENDCSTIFCKAIHLQDEMQALGYGFSDVLLDTTDGSLTPPVWDVFLYALLKEWGEDADAFFTACTTGDEDTKNAYHAHYMVYTIAAIQQFVDSLLEEVGQLTNQARTYDQTTHPRVPIIMAHNNLVLSTFLKVKKNLATMAEEAGEEDSQTE